MDQKFRHLERVLFGIEDKRVSVPIKKGTRSIRSLVPENSSVKVVTPRQVTALAVAALAQNLEFRAGVQIERVFQYGGCQWAIENGCGQDIIKSGVAELICGESPVDDQFILNIKAIEWVTVRIFENTWLSSGGR